MAGQFEGQRCLVTGAGRGIGRALALGFSREGATVIVLDRDAENALAVTREIIGKGGVASHVVVDLERHRAVRASIDAVVQTLGGIDVLVNNAAFVPSGSFLETSPDELEKVLAVNLMAPFACAQAVASYMIDRGYGRIVNIVSHSGLRGSTSRAAYAASKGALIAATRVIAVELAPHGITVNSVAPGPVETEHTRSVHSEARRSAWTIAVPMGRYGSGDEVAAAVLFLASTSASYITGHTLVVDGGFTEAGLIERNR